MALRNLRVYNGPHTDEQSPEPNTLPMQPMVTVSLREVLPTLVDAVNNQRLWLEDFQSDEVSISADLYEVLLAYQQFRRPSA